MKPTSEGDRRSSAEALNMVEEPERIGASTFRIFSGSDTVASMVVWEKGRMKKSIIANLSFVESGVSRGREVGRGSSVGRVRSSDEWHFSWGSAGNGDSALVVLQPMCSRVTGQNDDFASMREVVTAATGDCRRTQPMPGIDFDRRRNRQLHAAAEALERLGIINQRCSIAKKEEILYVLGQESEPIVLERIRRYCI